MFEELREIEIRKIQINPYQPRSHFDLEDLAELANSIKAVGLIHPPIVRPVDDHFELISGERRVRAAQLAGLTHLKAILRNEDVLQSAQAALIENIQRVDLTASEIARALQQLIDHFGFSQEEVAKRVGKKRSSVGNYLRLLSLPRQIQDSLDTRAISFGHAKAILSLSLQEQQLLLHEWILKNDLSVRKAEHFAEKIARSETEQRNSKIVTPIDCHLADYIRKIQEHLGTKVEISGDANQGCLKIDYYSLDDLNRMAPFLESLIKRKDAK